MNEHDLLRLGMFVNELEHLRQKYGFWLQSADVHTLNEADSIATVTAGGGEYCVTVEQMKHNVSN